MKDVIVGDLIEHTNSHRIGKVLEVKPWPDGSVEYHVKPTDGSVKIWWSSRHIRPLPRT